MALINFAGIASGIDSSALIEALLGQQRAARVDPYEDQISEYKETNSAFGELKSLLGTLKTAAEDFRVINGGALSKVAGSSNETAATAVASNSATSGSYDLTVTSLASNATLSYNDRYASSSSVIDSSINDLASEADRTVSFTVGTGASQENIDIVLSSTTTAGEFVDAFNSQTDNATASFVNVGTSASPSYAMMMTSNSEGTEDGTIGGPSYGAEVGASFSGFTLDQASDASFTISGVTGNISRSSNTVSDVIPGVSFDLNSTGSSTITIGNDSDNTISRVQNFVDAYNDVVKYVNDNDIVTRVEEGEEIDNVFGPLAKQSLDNSILTTIRSALSDSGITGGSVNILADLGITTERDGTLAFDSEKLSDALGAGSGSVRSILENLGENLGAVDGTIAQYTRFNGLIDNLVNSNSKEVSSIEDQIAKVEKSLSSQEETLISRFARLESLIGDLQSQQSQLSSILGTL